MIKNLVMNLLQRVKALEYKLGLIADYVVETGTSGIWTYEKWQSGKAECWGSQTDTISSVGVSWASPIYIYSGLSRPSYPFAFTEAPSETVTMCRSVDPAWVCKRSDVSSNNTQTKAAIYALAKAQAFSTNQSVALAYHVIGKWK